ncbi:MAG TPA: S1/P1 nuclease [Janthinobacterium sp.]|nr:S1/P1 nuclease [Janthinobacterium sp.]
MKKLLYVLALGSAFVSLDAMAWGADGHRSVGAIADQLIKGTHAQQQVAALLLPGESLEKISTWADCVKGNYCGPQTQEMLDYVAANPQHSSYHYTDIPFQNAHYADGAAGSAPDDIVQTLKAAIAVLQGKGDDSNNPHHFSKRQALLLVAHLAGDITQPLHVGGSFIGKDGAFVVPRTRAAIDGINIFNTQGGNDLMLDDGSLSASSAKLIPPAPPQEGDAGKPGGAPKLPTRPLHSYWDSTVVDYAMRRSSVRTPEQFAQSVIAGKPEVAANSGDPVSWPYQWADDTLKASKLAYQGLSVGAMSEKTGSKGETYKVWAVTVPDNYPVPTSALARAQLIKGGYQLAALLGAIWP